MIIADTSIWIDHLKVTNIVVAKAIVDNQLYMHQYVIGELALGSLRKRQTTIAHFRRLNAAPVARPETVLDLIERASLFSRGLGYIDAHLLASCLLTGNCRLLTRDRRLHDAAEQLGIAA
jgi:predicted nucleic acid-binding protein